MEDKLDKKLKSLNRIESNTIAGIINTFLLKSTDFLNSFSNCVESKFFRIEYQLNLLDSKLILLEKKFKTVSLTERSKTFETDNVIKDIIKNSKVENIDQVESIILKKETINNSTTNTISIQEHPTFAKYFKMLKLGVPEQAIQLKMSADGLNPQYLSDPEKHIIISNNFKEKQ